MTKKNSIDPNALFALLKKFTNGGPYLTEDPSAGGLNLESSSLSAFDNQLQVTNPFGQPTNQIQLGNQNFGTPQDTRPLVYDWDNNPDGHDSLFNTISNKEDWTKEEEGYWREHRGTASMPDLQNPTKKNYQSLIDTENSVGGNPAGGDSYTSRGQITSDLNAGRISEDAAHSLRQQFEANGSAPRSQYEPSGNDPRIDNKGRLIGGAMPEGEGNSGQGWENLMRSGLLTSPGDADMESTLFNLGRGLGADKGTKGKGAMIGLAATSALMKGARGILSGVGHQKVNDETRRWYEEQLRRRDYTPDSQAQDNNYVGGYFGKDGGTVMNALRSYLEGGPTGGEPDDSIHSMFDPRYKEYQNLVNRQNALKEYQRWHASVQEENPQTGAEFQSLHNTSDSLAVATRYLPELENPTEVLWTNPTTGGVITKKLDQSPVSNPYSLDIVPTPWGDDRDQGNEFRAWVNKNHPEKAKEWNLDATGNPNNLYTRSAYYELGQEYEDAMKPKTAPKPDKKEETPEPRVATKIQTVIHPDGRRELRSVPYYNYDTRENIPLPGGASAIYVDENGQPMQSQKYGGIFEHENGGTQPPSSVDATMNYQVGQHVDFEYGGKKISGKIKKIENGKIYV